MSRLNEYNPEFGVVFDTEEDEALKAFLAANPGLAPGGAGGSKVGSMFGTPPAAPPRGGGTAPKAPAGPPPVPEGWRPGPTPGTIIRNDGFAGATLNPQTNQYEPDRYAPSSAALAAVGITRGGGAGGGIDYTAQKQQQQVAMGGVMTPAANWTIYAAGARAYDPVGRTTWQKDYTTGVWTPWGPPTNRIEQQAIMTAMQQQRQSGGATPQTTAAPGAGNVRLSTEAPFVPNPLQGNQGPLLSGFSPFTTPGREISGDGLRPMSTSSGLNTLSTRALNPGGPTFGVSGIRPMGGGEVNNYVFSQQSALAPYARFPDTTFMVPQSYQSGPSGFTLDVNGGAFQAFGIPFGITAPTATSPGGAGVAVLQGPQNVTMSNADKSVGYGLLVNSPMAYNNIGLTYGRELGGINRDAATGAVESLMLANAQEKYGPAGAQALLTMRDPGSSTGQPGLYGNLPMEGGGARTDYGWIFGGEGLGGDPTGDYFTNVGFAKGGRVMAGMHMMPDGSMMRGPMIMAGGGRAVSSPLGGRASTSGPKLMVTPEQMYLVGKSGKVYATMGEDNADPDRRPDRELLMLHGPRNATMDIVPLEPFAQGGRVQADQMSPAEIAMMLRARMAGLSGRPELEGAPPTGRVFAWYPGFAEGGTVTAAPAPPTGSFKTRPNGEIYWDPGTPVVDTPAPTAPEPTPTAPTPSGPVAPSTPPVGDISIDNPPPPPPPLPEENVGFDIFDPNILAPWEAEARRNAWREHLRQTIDEPRRRAAGFIPGTSTAIEVLQGDAPTEALGPGAYYSTDSQVNRVIGEILGAQSDYRALGPEEDVTPVRERATYLGNAIDDFARIRQLEDARVAAQAGGNVPSVDPSVIADLQAQLAELGQQIGAAEHGLTLYPDPTGTGKAHLNQLYEQRNELEQRIEDAQKTGLNVADKVSVIDAQIASIRSRLPAGASEADVRTELARLNERIQRQDKRVGLSKQVANLQKLGVPSLNGPIVPVKSPNAPGRLVAEP